MDFIYLYETELRNLLQLLWVGWRGAKGRDNGGNVNNEQYESDQNCHFGFTPCSEYILTKNL
jgi:hypothetical protein